MSDLQKKLQSEEMRKSVGRHRFVLDFTTSIEDEVHARGLSQSAFARLVGKSRAWISKVFRGKPNLTFFTAYDLADALDLDVKVEVVPRRPSNVLFLFGTRSVTNTASGGSVGPLPPLAQLGGTP